MTQEETFKITGMTCAACSARIERVLQREAGIDQINVNLVMENGTVKYDPSQISIEEIYERVAKIGYEAFPMETKDETAKRKSDELKRQKGKFIISLILALPLLYTMFGHFSFLGFIPVSTIRARFRLKRFMNVSLKSGMKLFQWRRKMKQLNEKVMN
ncbi:Lead, cadmium, zinc and mercury transporting ATPase; Copper-translocating P-type ATPase [Staphylococcus pseudintermedius]|nr:cation transporter [Staphylococcus pseudintermedius]ANS88992.1 Lead, cadmium, zinc and mercury transporting ATPase; Copper-translocating P-type ATPase [Staphylococcus pseudintermedius]